MLEINMLANGCFPRVLVVLNAVFAHGVVVDWWSMVEVQPDRVPEAVPLPQHVDTITWV
jgi:hypothetical protein